MSHRARVFTTEPARRRGALRTLAVVGATIFATAMSGLAVGAPAGTFGHPDARGQAVSWGGVTTVWDHPPESINTVTTNNGMVVAAWSGRSFRNLWISVRRPGDTWTEPTKIVGSAAAVALAKDGKGAWVLWQGFDTVSALQVGADGSIGTPDVLGPSSDPFVSDAQIAAGSNGSVAAVWHTHDGQAATIAYRPAGADWTAPAAVPQLGSLSGLVVGAAGTAQLVLSQNNPDFEHQQISYLRRSPTGTWSTPFVLSSQGTLATVAGNGHGDIVVGWEVVNDDNTFTLVARYKAAESGFGAAHHLDESVPENTYVALAMAGDGRLAAAYRIQDSGSEQLQMTPADSTGLWLTPQTLSMTGATYAVAMNVYGSFVVTSEQGSGLQLVTCDATDDCGSPQTNPATRYRFPSTTIGPSGVITLVWGRGCKSEECYPTRLVAQRGH